MNACHNRKPFSPTTRVQDGWASSWARNMVDMEFRMTQGCVYSTSDLGQVDKGCIGCRWRANGQADTGAGAPDQVGNGLPSLPGVCGVEGEGTGSEVPEGDGKPSDAAEQRRELEKTWPTAALYAPVRECPSGCALAAQTDMNGRACPYFHAGLALCVERECRNYRYPEGK